MSSPVYVSGTGCQSPSLFPWGEREGEIERVREKEGKKGGIDREKQGERER